MAAAPTGAGPGLASPGLAIPGRPVPCWLTQCGRCTLLMTGRTFPLRNPADISKSLTICQATSGWMTPAAARVAAVIQIRCGCGPGPEMTGRRRSSASATSRR